MTARQLAPFLEASDPRTAAVLRLDRIEPRGTELFDRRQEILLIHVEVQRTSRPHFGQRMLDYYTLLRRSTGLPFLPTRCCALSPASPISRCASSGA